VIAQLERSLQPVTALGRNVIDRWQAALNGLSFAGETTLRFSHGFLELRVWRPISIARRDY